MPERRPERTVGGRFVRAANFVGMVVIAASVVVLLLPQPNHAQTGQTLDAPGKVAPDKFGKSPEEIAAAKAKWEAMKAAKEAKAKAAQAAKAEKQAKAKAERQTKKSAAAVRKKDDDDDHSEDGARKKCPPGEVLDKRSRGGCI